MRWDTLLSNEVFHYFIVFTRFAAVFSFLPVYGSAYVPRRLRLMFAILTAVAITPILSPILPEFPDNLGETFRILMIEITAGLFLGLTGYFLLAAVDLAGTVSAQASSFANATAFDPTSQVQSTVLTTFLTLLALTLIVVTGLYQTMFSAAIGSYEVFVPGKALIFGDMAQSLVQTLSASFVYGFKIASPFIMMMIILYSAMGVMSRLMPQLNILFVVMPFQIYLGLSLLMLSLSMMMMWFLRYFEAEIARFAM